MREKQLVLKVNGNEENLLKTMNHEVNDRLEDSMEIQCVDDE